MHIEKKQLQEKYFTLQKMTHPDTIPSNPCLRPCDLKQQCNYSNKYSSLISTAYHTLSNEDSRIDYIIELKNIEDQIMDEQWLEQVMEWRERAEEGQNVLQEVRIVKESLWQKLRNEFQSKNWKEVKLKREMIRFCDQILQQ